MRAKWGIIILIMVSLITTIGTYYNEALYDKPIAKIVHTKITAQEEVHDRGGNKDTIYEQQMEAIVLNGTAKNTRVTLTNEFSESGAFDTSYRNNQRVFIAFDDDSETTAHIVNQKRDYAIVLLGWLFIATLLIVGTKKGLLALISFSCNITVLLIGLELYSRFDHLSLLIVSAVIVLLFTLISLLFVNGCNAKTYTAVIATLIGTGTTMAIAFVVMLLTKENGLHYEEMQFLTRPYQTVFLAGLLIGSLGAVMDVAITLASSLFALQERNPKMTLIELKKSGRVIGQDIMGTITNILFFAYVSGAIPMLLLYFKNGLPFGYTLSMNLSLEIARALVGGIGVVLTIPITIHVSLWFMTRRQVSA